MQKDRDRKDPPHRARDLELERAHAGGLRRIGDTLARKTACLSDLDSRGTPPPKNAVDF